MGNPAMRVLPGIGILWLLVTSPVSGQGVSAGQVRLGVKPSLGKPVRFVHELEEITEGAPAAGGTAGTPPMIFRVETEFSLEVAEVMKEGGYRGTVRFGRIKGFLDGPKFDPTEFDSTAWTRPAGFVQLISVLPRLVMAGMEIPADYGAGGEVVALTGFEAIRDARFAAMGLGKFDAMGMRRIVDEEFAKELVHGALMVLPVPSAERKSGEGFDVEVAVRGGMRAMDCVLSLPFRVAQWDESTVDLKAMGTMSIRKPRAPAVEPMGVKDSKASAEARLSRVDGLPVQATARAEGMLLAEEGPPAGLRRTLKSTLRRVETWPSQVPKSGGTPSPQGPKPGDSKPK